MSSFCPGALACLLLAVVAVYTAPEPKNFLFEDADREMTTEGSVVTEPVNEEYLLEYPENSLLSGSDNLLASPSEPAESLMASASSTASSSSSSSSTSNSIGANSAKLAASNQQASLLLLQQLSQQLQRQQQLQKQLQQPHSQKQQQQQPQFSLDALVKSFVKVFQVAKVKIDQGARTVRDILQFFDKNKYTSISPQASETNFVVS